MSEILKWVEPKIKLDSMKAINLTYNNEEIKDNIGQVPWINIRSFNLQSNLIQSLTLDYSNFFPMIYLTFDDSDNSFKSLDFPLENDIISIYVSPKSSKHKAIRNDFKILSITENYYTTIIGILKIPNAFDSKTFGINGSSIETIFKASRNLNLGFASNFENSNDVQNWISFNQNFETFINNVKKQAFIDKESWIFTFIDPFYCLNWLNGEIAYNLNNELDKGIITTFNSVENATEISKIDTFILTNHPNFLESDYGVSISPYFNSINKQILNGTFIDLSKGEIKSENFFLNEESNSQYKKIESRDVNDIITEKNNWLGIQSSNVHKNWNTSKGQFEINSNQDNFSGLSITSNGLTTEIMKGRRIPIIIIDLNSQSMEITKQTSKEITTEFENNKKPDINEFWSGFYVCTTLKFEYTPGYGWKTLANMKRKQWNRTKNTNHFGYV